VGRDRNRVSGHAHEHLIAFVGERNPRRPRKQYPEKKAVGRPPKAKAEAAPAPTPKPAPKPGAVKPEPVKRSPATPNLNTRAEQRRLAEKLQEQKPKPYVTADQLRALSATHPARLAWTRAAYHGPQAATDAFHQAMSQLKQAA
jgi:hypothetical protein